MNKQITSGRTTMITADLRTPKKNSSAAQLKYYHQKYSNNSFVKGSNPANFSYHKSIKDSLAHKNLDSYLK